MDLVSESECKGLRIAELEEELNDVKIKLTESKDHLNLPIYHAPPIVDESMQVFDF
jgi:hypothetical protein